IDVTVLSKKIGIDLGTSTVLVYVKGEGIVVNEPALMATDERGARVLAVGRAASELLGRGGKARAVRPVRDGDGVDYDAAGAMVGMLALESISIGGAALDRAIEEAVAATHGVRLQPGEAERLKVAVGSATVPAAESWLELAAVRPDGESLRLRLSGKEVQGAI